MWIIILTMFFMGIIGDEMTFFRVINVGFCLIFFMLFHLSFKLWLKTMYVYWLSMIIYAIIALILNYSYQFESFPKFALEKAFGLKKLEAKELLVKLLSFTLVIFLTGLQMNRFHYQILLYFEGKKRIGSVHQQESSTDDEVLSVRVEKALDLIKSSFESAETLIIERN